MSAQTARESAPPEPHPLDLISTSTMRLISLLQAIDYCVDSGAEHGDGVPSEVIHDCLMIAVGLGQAVSEAAADMSDILDGRAA